MKKLTALVFLLFLYSYTFSQIKVACVGNSITYGAGIEGRDSLAYPQQLGKILGDGWIVRNFGHSGATTLNNGDRPYGKVPEFSKAGEFLPDVVIILLGTNDSKPHNWDEFGDEFQSDYEKLIEHFSKLDSKPVIFPGLPIPVVEDTWGIRKEVTEVEITEIIKKIATKYNLTTIDFYSNLKSKARDLPDNIHPNAEGSRIMAMQAALVLLKNESMILNR